MRDAFVAAVSARKRHQLSKLVQSSITLVAGCGVEGDAHFGELVQHRSRKRFNPTLPNLRQVHLLAQELLDELAISGFAVSAGDMGENILTQGLDLVNLPKGTTLRLGERAIVELTGLRNPCVQLDRFMPGLMAATLDRDQQGELVRKAGVMAIVLSGGIVSPGDAIACAHPPGVPVALKPV